MRFSTVIIGYFVMGAVMWGGGAIDWNEAGVGQAFVDDPTTGNINESTATDLKKTGGPIQEVAGSIGGSGLLAMWNLIVKFVGYLFWPITTLQSVGAPTEIWVLLGGAPTIAFFGAFARIVRGSA